jgi:hypothetical protein
MRKLAGTDVITLIKTALKDETVLREAQSLSRDDFASNDLLNECFFRVCPQGFSSEQFRDKTASTEILNKLESAKKEIINSGLRKAFNYLQNVRNAEDAAVVLENELNDTQKLSTLEFQHKASNLINFLSKYVDGESVRESLATSCTKVLHGDIADASSLLHNVFARTNPSQNIKTAFVTIKQQIGEGYQMCPKGIFQTGQPVPMAISSCRDYCVDSRLNPDGSVGCNYIKWLNDHVITQEQALNVYDKMKSEQTTSNLEPGQRTKFPMSDQDSQDMRVIRDEKLTESVTTKSWEEQLEKVHTKNEAKAEGGKKVKSVDDDGTLETMLRTMRDVFDEDELDNLEQQLREAIGE